MNIRTRCVSWPGRTRWPAPHLVVVWQRDDDRPPHAARPGRDDQLVKVMEWARANLDQPLSNGELARRALMSERTFARRFKAATGSTPYSWLQAQRMERAEVLLETTDLGVEQISRLVGYNTAAVFREGFVKRHGVPPRSYRRRFRRPVP
ncbi:helix-turn-helix domain-containing protein [Nonomuraea antri]|uniref:helix-turn-helix domain-containing protein n=1 Tax=Nonomuraea antri TaxID=2730852 RepID=UPI001F1D7A65|nr:helix-turn-helix domain-containing protein [Nonomuraea antri]